jgi:hypothetical protein
MFPGARKLVSQAANDVARGIDTVIANIGFAELTKLKAAGGSLGQIAIRELDLLQQLRGSLAQDLSKPEFRMAVDRIEKEAKNILARQKLLQGVADDGRNSLTADEMKQYQALGGGAAGGAATGGVKRLNVQRGQSAGTSTLAPAAPDLSAFEGRVLVNPQGKRVRIVNGKEVPLQ